MAEGRLTAAWDIGSQIIVRLENAWLRDPKKDGPCSVWEIHPFRERAEYIAALPQGDITDLKGLINNGRRKSSNQSR